MKLTHLAASLLALSGLGLSGAALPAVAAEAPSRGAGGRPPEDTIADVAPHNKRTSIDAGASLVTQYVSRGVAFSKKPSLQPHIALHVAVPEAAAGPMHDVSWTVGAWGSLQAGDPGLGQANRGTFAGIYEADVYTGAGAKFGRRWSGNLTLYRYGSPAHSFRAYNDLELIARWDDSGLWPGGGTPRNFHLAPAVRLVQELARPGRKDALYVEPSITPSFDVGDPERPVKVSLPIVAGFSQNYYNARAGGNVRFGYVRTSLLVSAQPFDGPAKPVTVSAGLDLWLPNDQVANGLPNSVLVGRVALGRTF